MRRDAQSMSCSFLDDSAQLRFGVLQRADGSFKGEHAGSGTHLYDLDTMLDLISDGFDYILHAICNTGPPILFRDARRETRDITMAARDAQCMTGWDNARPLDEPFVYRVHQRNVDKAPDCP